MSSSNNSKQVSSDAPKYTETAPPSAPKYEKTLVNFSTSLTASTSRVLK